MLGVLRKHKNSPIIVAVLGLVALLMVVFGISVNQVSSSGSAAIVNGEEIPYSEFASRYAREYQQRQSRDRNYDRTKAERDELRETVLYRMINSKILAQEARRQGLAIDDKALRDAIIANETFHIDGRFSKRQYERAVSGARLSGHRFEALERERLLAEKLYSAIQSMPVSDIEVKQAFERENTKVDIEFVELSNRDFEADVGAVNPADVEAWKSGTSDAEDKVKAYYARNKRTKYDVPKKACVQHILARVDVAMPPEAQAKARKTIEDAAAALKGGVSFEEAAKKYSEDVSNKDKGGDLGCIAQGEAQEQLVQAAFGLEPGKISSVVKTPFGLHILKLNEVQEPVQKTIDEVRNEIETELAKSHKASRLAQEKANALVTAAKEKATLAEAASAFAETNPNLQVTAKETGPFPRGRDFIPKLGMAKEVGKAAWTLTAEKPLAETPVKTDKGWVVIRLKSREDPKPEDFETAKLGLTYRLILEKQNAIDEWSKKLREKVQDKNELLIDPIAVRYDEEAEQARQQRRQQR